MYETQNIKKFTLATVVEVATLIIPSKNQPCIVDYSDNDAVFFNKKIRVKKLTRIYLCLQFKKNSHFTIFRDM